MSDQKVTLQITNCTCGRSFWYDERIRELEAEVARLKAEYSNKLGDLMIAFGKENTAREAAEAEVAQLRLQRDAAITAGMMLGIQPPKEPEPEHE